MKEAILYGNDGIVEMVREIETGVKIKNVNIEKAIDAICEKIQKDVKKLMSLAVKY